MLSFGRKAPNGVLSLSSRLVDIKYGKVCVESAGRFEKFFLDGVETAVPIEAVRGENWASWLDQQDATTQSWAASMRFSGRAGDHGRHLIIPDESGKVKKVVLLVGDVDGYGEFLSFSALPTSLPRGVGPYKFISFGGVDPDMVALGWALGCYSFDYFKKGGSSEASISNTVSVEWPEGANKQRVKHAGEAIFLVRDLISTPAQEMAPGDLQDAAESLASMHKGASTSHVIGKDLLSRNFPMVHAVGRAAAEGYSAPRLIELKWGSESDPRITLVGKGVTFDTGGLDLKPAAAMRVMKKDMGGAAQVLGLAHMIMANNLKVHLRVLIPAVENAVGGNAFRPGDILTARNGLTTEIGNTDAEGRLILADALVAACEEPCDLLIDCATLTGAGRVALGTDVPAVFVNDEALAASLQAASEEVDDLVWRLPLFKGYGRMLASKFADMKNVAEGSGYGGAIIAALYLQKFIKDTKWIHMDHMAYNTASRPGRPEGGEAMGMRALFELIQSKYPAPS